MGYEYSTPEIEVIMFHSQDVMTLSHMEPTNAPSVTTQPTTESEWTGYY